jgi:hypothetical protein
VAVAVHVHVPALPRPIDHGELRSVHERMELQPCNSGFRIAAGSLANRAICVELPAVQMVNHHVRKDAEARMNRLLHGDHQLVRVQICGRRHWCPAGRVGAVGNLRRCQVAPMGRGQDHRTVAGDIFDVIVAPKV